MLRPHLSAVQNAIDFDYIRADSEMARYGRRENTSSRVPEFLPGRPRCGDGSSAPISW